MIKDVVVKEIVTHWDERGFFRELINKKDNDFFKPGIAQWSLSIMYPGVIKAWHIHKIQFDWWYVGNGVLKVALYDKREDSSTYGQLMEFMLGEGRPPMVVKIPPGVANGCKCISGPSQLFYLTSNSYNPEDEGRIPHDDPEIGYDWLKPPPIT